VPEESDQNDSTQWLVEPPGAGEVVLYVSAGEGAEVSDAAREALNTLMRELQMSEVEGFALGPPCPDFEWCFPYSCTLANCHPQFHQPCLIDAGCKIAPLRQ
jgi:hypothetical protein